MTDSNTLVVDVTDTPWLPATFTKPLSDQFESDGFKVIQFCVYFVKILLDKPFALDEWQAWLIQHVLERYPADWPVEGLRTRLRYRQVIISMGRQNGKSVLAALLGIYGLLFHEQGPTVIGLASNADQARIIYDKVRYIINNNDLLRAQIKTTGYHGIRRTDKTGTYFVKAARADALQGFTTTLCLFDEVHICHPDMWQAMVKGITTVDDGIVIGFTTAGNDLSVLLKDKYELGRRAAAGDASLERFGFFCWEAPAGCAIDDPEAIKAANPSVVAGRTPIENLLEDVRTSPPAKARRFTLNQFQEGSSTAWMDPHHWIAASAAFETVAEALAEARPVLTLDRTQGGSHAFVTATYKLTDDNGSWFYTEAVADTDRTDDDELVQMCAELYDAAPLVFAMDDKPLGNVARILKQQGYPVMVVTLADLSRAHDFVYRKVTTGRVKHGTSRADKTITEQWSRGVTTTYGDSQRISRKHSLGEIDGLLATVEGIYAAETYKENIPSYAS